MSKTSEQIEVEIATKLIDDALAAGFTIDVNDGEDTPLENSTDKAAILAAMRSTDEDYLILKKAIGANKFLAGWVRFVFGNECSVISDYTMNIEAVVKGAEALADTLERASTAEA